MHRKTRATLVVALAIAGVAMGATPAQAETTSCTATQLVPTNPAGVPQPTCMVSLPGCTYPHVICVISSKVTASARIGPATGRMYGFGVKQCSSTGFGLDRTCSATIGPVYVGPAPPSPNNVYNAYCAFLPPETAPAIIGVRVAPVILNPKITCTLTVDRA